MVPPPASVAGGGFALDLSGAADARLHAFRLHHRLDSPRNAIEAFQAHQKKSSENQCTDSEDHDLKNFRSSAVSGKTVQELSNLIACDKILFDFLKNGEAHASEPVPPESDAFCPHDGQTLLDG